MNQAPATVLVLWALLALACLVGVAYCIRAEGRWFAAQDKRRPWQTLRICTVPIAISTAGLVILVTQLVGGADALKALYVMLFAVAPLAYFGQHWIAAHWLKPRLAGGESAWIAFSGLMVLIGPVALISGLNPWVFAAARVLDSLF